MADVKRKFYGAGDAKGFTKAVFFKAVLDMANGEEVADDVVALIGAAAEYELEGIALKAEKTSTGEKKDPLESDYAKEVAAVFVPMISGTPMTAKELIEKATAAGKVSQKTGKEFSAPWVSRVLKAQPGINAVAKVVDKVSKDGLKSQASVTAYVKG